MRASPPPVEREALTEEQLVSLDCTGGEALPSARNVNRPETDRLGEYSELYSGLRRNVQSFDESLKRNPDLRYQRGNAKLLSAREACVQQAADVRLELDRFVRELAETPTAQEVKGGAAATVARVDFDVLKKAIEALDPPDRETLMSKVGASENQMENAPEKPSRTRGKNGKRGRNK